MDIFIQAADIVAPVFIIVFIGLALRRAGMIDAHFNALSSRLVFMVTLPALLFAKISSTRIQELIDGRQILFAYLFIFISFAIAWLAGLRLAKSGRDRGAFIQGAFRGNFAILGFAMLNNAYGPGVLAPAAVVLAAIMPPYNILAVLALSLTQKRERDISGRAILKQILTNPLILAAAGAVPFSLFQIRLPQMLLTSIDHLSSLTLPLALIGIGGSLSFKGVREDFRLAFHATLLKIVLLPILVIAAAVHAGFHGPELGVLFFFFASPTAIASYAMAEAMGSNSRLAGHIILLTTMGSIITISTGIIILKSMGVF
ncbi:MAG: Membrane transport protein [bacterium ADurb.Bin431]|jgi:predicted permease|nr:MAG: Membrane transport protein [bacterium ADurb.Bin431]HNY92315.1 AEC family transporter [bacterium]HOC26255.1 AEC family transporter [bacterium]HOH07744.1 AEC family transporter [bacterium]HOY44501.1 AEC family transporter [bacterium]